ncbi:hypothetical protein J3F83DRAFT_721228 [Trichoderma novae-zelandiae]
MLVIQRILFLFGRSAWGWPQLYPFLFARCLQLRTQYGLVWLPWSRVDARKRTGQRPESSPFYASMTARRLIASDEAITLSIQLGRWFSLLGTTHFPVSWGRTLTATVRGQVVPVPELLASRTHFYSMLTIV